MADDSGYIYWYNRRWYEYTGTTAEQMVGWGWKSVHHPDVLEVVTERWTASLATGEPFDMTFPLRSANGEYRPFLTRVHPYRDDSGVVTGWFGNNIEISAQTAAEDALRTANIELKASIAEARYLASIVEFSDEAIIGKDLDGRIRSWNRAAERTLGYSAHEIIGRDIGLLFPPDRTSEKQEILDRIQRGEHVEQFETVRRHKDGHSIPVSLVVSPIRDAHGVIVGASKSLRDISARLDTQRALARSEAEFRASFEGAAVGSFLAEPGSRRILRANQTLACLLGYEPAQMVGRLSTEFIWHEDREEDEAEYALLLNGGANALVSEQRYIRQDGTPIWVRVSATLVRAPDGNRPVLAVIAVEDIDIRHRSQIDLLEAKRDLEQVVEERTAAFEQRNLLLREVYHRVKNNLQVVDSMLMMQVVKISDPLARLALTELRSRVFALGLVHQKLMGSSDLKTFDIGSFLTELSENIISSAADERVQLKVDACVLDVGLDFAMPLGLLVTEIVTNSLKHAFPDGVGEIVVTFRLESGGRVVLTVADNGRGQTVKPQTPAKIGSGSSIIRKLVAQLAGDMIVRHDSGTTTEITMPLREAS